MNYLSQLTICLFAGLLIALTSCAGSSKPALKVAATSVPHAELLELIQPDLHAQEVNLEIIIVDDFNTPNRALADGEVDANFFQHIPFLDTQKRDFGYQLEALVGVHLEPMGIYSKKIGSLQELKHGASIALPSDPSNQARALALLEKNGLITLKVQGTKASVLDIEANPWEFHFIEMDSPLLTRSLDDVEAAMITTNFALLGGLLPKKDALAIEDGQSSYVNFLVVREGESKRPDLQALKRALTSERVREYIQEHYKGAVEPAF